MLELLEVMRFVLICILEAAEESLYLLDMLDVPEVMRSMLLCMLEAVEGGFSFGGFEIPID